MYKKKMALATIFAASALMLGACGGGGTSSSSAASSAAKSSATASTTSEASSSKTVVSSTASSSTVVSTDVSILNGWEDTQDESYVPTYANNTLSVAYDKAGAGWASMKYSLGTVAPKLGSSKKLVMKFKVTGHQGVGPFVILPKIEFNDTVAHPAKECRFQFSETEATYEWDLSDQALTDALTMLVFVEPDCVGTKGTLVFSAMYFSNDAVSASGTVIVGKTITKTVNTYATGDTFDVLKNFYDGGDFAYKITETAGEVDVDYSKWGQSYSYFGNVNANVANFDYVNVTLQGPANKMLLMKAEGDGNNREETIKLTGEVQNYTYSFKDKTTRAGNEMINFFAEPGASDISSGTLKLTKLEFSNTALVTPVVEAKNEITAINPWDSSYELTSFKEDGAAILSLAKNTAGKTTVTWANQGGSSWNWVGAPISGKAERGVFTHVVFDLTADAATKVMGKIQAGNAGLGEKTVEFTATALNQTIDVDLSAKTFAERSAMDLALFFPIAVDGHAASGTITINSIKLTTPIVPSAVTDGYEAINGIVGQLPYDMTYGTTTKVSYIAAKGDWDMVGFALDPTVDYSTIKTIRVHIDAVDACTKIKFKINDTQEYNIDDLTDLTNDFVLTLNTSINAAKKSFVGMFLNYGLHGAAGSVTFSKIELSTKEGGQVIQNKYTGINAWDTSWGVSLWKDGGDSLYTVTNGTATSVSWTGGTAAHTDHQWSTVQAPVSGDVSFMTAVKFNITLSAACKVLCKVQGTGIAVEQWATFTDTTLTQDVTVNLSAKTIAERQGINTLCIFPIAGDAGSFLDAGTITINSTAFVNPMAPVAGTDSYDALGGLFGPSSYAFTRGTTTKVDYTAAKGEWEAMGFALDKTVDYSAYTKLVLHIDAVEACTKIMVKVNDHEEYKIDDLTSLTNDFTLTLTTTISAATTPFVTFFLNYGVTGAAGSVTLSKVQLAK